MDTEKTTNNAQGYTHKDMYTTPGFIKKLKETREKSDTRVEGRDSDLNKEFSGEMKICEG